MRKLIVNICSKLRDDILHILDKYKDDLTNLYTQKFVSKGQANRDYYEILTTMQASDNLCAYCRKNIVNKLVKIFKHINRKWLI